MSKRFLMKAEELDELFDNGKDITEYLDMSPLTKNATRTKKVNVDFPEWVITLLIMKKTLERNSFPYGETISQVKRYI